MLVKTKWIFKGFDAFTCYPFIFVRPEKADNQALLAHETVHYQEQRKWFVVPWLLAYLLSPSFRCRAELRAYRQQIAMGGITVQQAAKLMETYHVDITAEEAEIALIHG